MLLCALPWSDGMPLGGQASVHHIVPPAMRRFGGRCWKAGARQCRQQQSSRDLVPKHSQAWLLTAS